MNCPECKSENREGVKFCEECGAKMELVCPSCEAKIPIGKKFCGDCGLKLTLSSEPAAKDLSFDEKIAKIQRYLPEGLTEKILSQRDRIEGERKHVTVMFCDMEGFTALTEKLGPEEAYAIMDDIYEILIHKVHDYEGTVNEMTGDGILALFGAPIALEDAPQRAIRSAMAIHREMVKFSDRVRKERVAVPTLKMRVGIHTGPVVVGTLGNDLRVEFKAVGDTVNLASRMEALAEPGTTYVTDETFCLTEGLFRFEALGTKEIRGKGEPVNVYQVIAPSTRRTRFDVSAERGLTPFVGRERELELLLDGFERARSGRGQAFSIIAEAGLGKSRLLYEFRKALATEEVTFLEGKSLSYSRGIAYHPVIDILKSNFDIREDDGVNQIVEKVKEGLRHLGTDDTAILPYLLDVLSVEENGIQRRPLSPETRKERIIEALRTIVLKGSEVRPLIMAFEDLHWVDRSSEELLKSLLESIPGAKVFLLFTYRPEFVHGWGGKSYHSQLNLVRLSNRESLMLVTHLLGTDNIDQDIQELILAKTEGVPFFLEEFVKSLTELQIIEKRDNTYSIAEDAQEMTIPSTIHNVIMARVDSLPEGAKEVLQTASVIDREFSYGLINRIAGLPEQELLSRLSRLKDSELLYERGIYPEASYAFKHALTQEVAYDGLLSKKRKETHEKIGKSIEELYSERLEEHYELLAYHYVRSDNKEKAVVYLDLSNRKSANANALDEAKAYFDQAMELLDSLPDTERNRECRISLLVNAWHMFTLLLRTAEYHELMTRHEPLVARIRSPHLAGRFYASLGWAGVPFGLFQASIENSKRGFDLCEAASDAEGAGSALNALQACYLWTGKCEQAIALKDEISAKYDERIPLRRAVLPLLYASLAYSFVGLWDEAVRECQEVERLAREYLDDSVISYASMFMSLASTLRGNSDQAIKYGELAIGKAATPQDKYFSQGALAWGMCRVGEFEKGIESLAELVQVFRAGRVLTYESGWMPMLAEGYLLAGRFEKARQSGEEAVVLGERSGTKWHLGYARRILGEIALATDPQEATNHFEKAISISQEIKAENELALAYSGMGRFHTQQGNLDEARKYLTEALEIFERLGTLIEPDKVKKELAELRQ